MKAWIAVREYQKRGLPHTHSVYWLDEIDGIKTEEQLDQIIRAEIPDKENEPKLYELVKKFMMHGPCTKNMACMQRDGVKCSKGFPKPFSEKTIITRGGFPQYRRRDDGRCVYVNGKRLTNQHVVSYNPILLLIFECHINCELAAGLWSIAYLLKYFCKGNDKVATELNINLPSYADQIHPNIVDNEYFNEEPFNGVLNDFPENMFNIDFNLNENFESNEIINEENEIFNNEETMTNYEATEASNDENTILDFVNDLPANAIDNVINNLHECLTIDQQLGRHENFVPHDEIKKYESNITFINFFFLSDFIATDC